MNLDEKIKQIDIFQKCFVVKLQGGGLWGLTNILGVLEKPEVLDSVKQDLIKDFRGIYSKIKERYDSFPWSEIDKHDARNAHLYNCKDILPRIINCFEKYLIEKNSTSKKEIEIQIIKSIETFGNEGKVYCEESFKLMTEVMTEKGLTSYKITVRDLFGKVYKRAYP